LACLISATGLFIAAQNLGTVWALVGNRGLTAWPVSTAAGRNSRKRRSAS
jgi:hypothetical protein